MANYIDNTRFEELVLRYCKNDKTSEDELMKMFDILIDNIFMAFNFDLDQEDSKQECFLLIIRVLKNFDESKGNAFNYFTTVILNNLRLMYTKNKIYNEKLETYFERKSHIMPFLTE
jgi:DNA-directed RNA polymerase specialized sigma subunit